MRSFTVICAHDIKNGIGKNNGIPWILKSDMKRFREITTNNIVIMGRKTFESIGKCLPNRINAVISSSNIKDDVLTFNNLNESLNYFKDHIQKIFIIGGQRIYQQSLKSDLCEQVLVTQIFDSFDCDVFFPYFDQSKFVCETSDIQVENDIKFVYKSYSKIKDYPEQQYLDLIDKVLQFGTIKDDRTGTGVVSYFGHQMRFSLKEGFPLLTTKRVFWRAVVEELLWFIKGGTSSKDLENKNINIWKGNTTREFLDKSNLNYEEGDLGPIYGFQWRHWGAEYINSKTDYSGKGIDQLKECIFKIKNCPDDRRIIMSAWNVQDLNKMALPPCHCFCQFYVVEDKLSCHLYQRSGDLGLGVPFNIASYALLTHLMAQVCELKVGELIHSLGDVHIYKPHVKHLINQTNLKCKQQPILKLNDQIKDIDLFTIDDIELLGYDPHPTIKMELFN